MDAGWQWNASSSARAPNLVLAFGGYRAMTEERPLEELGRAFPGVPVVGCSTAGEIEGTRVFDDTIVATAIGFEHTRVEVARVTLEGATDSRSAGGRLARMLAGPGLTHVFVVSEGVRVNGSELVKGLTSALPANVAVTGGLSGDGARMQHTVVYFEGAARPDSVVGIGFYGDRLKVGYGSLGGWDPFGPERVVTRSEGNILYELDGLSALSLYKEYLGEQASELPASALLFPLSIRITPGSTPVVRTVLGVDEAKGAMIFAGDIPQHAQAQLMKANFDRLIDGAFDAAKASIHGFGNQPASLAILISCVGRKLILKQRVEEEIESVRDVLGPNVALTGFYSYGEIAPFTPAAQCELHNQTMTITTLLEV